MNEKKHNLNIAFCVGDLVAATPMLRGLCGSLSDYNINLHIFNAFSSEFDDEPQDIGQINIYNLPNYDILDMLIVAPFFLSTNTDTIDSVISRAEKSGVPVLSIGVEHEGCYCLRSNYSHEIEELTSHFINKHNFRDLVFMAGLKHTEASIERTEGYKNAMLKAGLGFDESNIYYGNFWDAPARLAVDEMISKREKLPQAIICANDTMASATIIRLEELGYKIPNDVAVSGMDGIDEASGYITTARIFSETTGKMAADIAKQILIDGKAPDPVTFVPPIIEYGASCGCNADAVALSAKKRHDLFDEIYGARVYSKNTLRLTQELSNSSSYEEAAESLYFALSKMWVNSSAICICEDFFVNTPSKITSAKALESGCEEHIHSTDFSENMFCMAAYRNKTRVGQGTFPTSQMLPDFYSVSDECKCILYSPLHYRDNTIGYLAFDFYPWSNISYILNILTIGISTMLESVKRQNEIMAYAKRIDELYVTDLLTGLYNRRGFFRLYSKYMEGSNKTDCMVISVDLDNLKQINDNFGHNEGDNAISTTANALKSAASSDDICARFGGDEYVMFGRCNGENHPLEYINKVNEYLAEYNKRSGKPYNVHASCGSCIMPKDSNKHIDFYLNAADSKMYVNKKTHKRGRELNEPKI